MSDKVLIYSKNVFNNSPDDDRNSDPNSPALEASAHHTVQARRTHRGTLAHERSQEVIARKVGCSEDTAEQLVGMNRGDPRAERPPPRQQ